MPGYQPQLMSAREPNARLSTSAHEHVSQMPGDQPQLMSALSQMLG
jgi:hypothetical protein